MWKMIGNANEYNGLYYLESNFSNKGYMADSSSCLSTMSCEDFMLWLCRLDHPSFDYMKLLFLNSMNKMKFDFQCDICPFAKQTRTSYLSTPNVPSKTFALINSDVWGPSRVATN